MVVLVAGMSAPKKRESLANRWKNNALERIPVEREHLFREGEHRFWKIPKSVHLEPEWVFILGRNMQAVCI